MSPFLSDADYGVTELGRKARAAVTVAEADDAYSAHVIDEFLAARAESRFDLMQLIRDHAEAIDPDLLAELDGLDYPAAA
ncbi:hypothetical protein [Streptomyces sp. NPDC002853]